MRFLEQGEILAMLPAEPEKERLAEISWNSLVSERGGDTTRLRTLTESGQLATAQINYEGRPAVVLWYRREHNHFIVDTLVSLCRQWTSQQAFAIIYDGIAGIARSFGCDYLEGWTNRAVLARIYQSNGFEPVGVLMRRKL